MASLGVEFGASRLLAPYFGTSLYVWGVLIGLILVYLSAGYVIGGRLADRHPREEVLYQITAWAGLWIGIIPLVSYPILLISQQGFKELSFGLVLVAVSVAGLWRWPRRRIYASFAVAVILAWIFLPSGIKPPQVGQLIYEKESAYGYIQVVRDGTKTELILNEGEAVHSIYDTQSLLTGGPWDYMLVADSFRPAEQSEITPKSVAILGLAGGTAARQYTAAFGSGVQITGVEIDPDILDVAHRYFHLDEPNVHPVVADARYWLDTQARQYDVVVMDAYRQPYIPFHLTTREFFSEVRDHLRPGGVAVVNAGRTRTDYRLVDAIASTMAAVYPSVFLVDVPEFSNTLVYGTTETVMLADVEHNLGLVNEPFARDVAQSVLSDGRLRLSSYHSQVFTDDLAPVERLIDEIIFGYVTGR